MRLRKKLLSLLLAVGITNGIAGCKTLSTFPECDTGFHFDGDIGEERVRFTESCLCDKNKLYVEKKNGENVEYFDIYDDDFKIEKVITHKVWETDNKEYYWDTNPEAMEQFQNEFIHYLTKIKEQSDYWKK